MVEPSKGVSRNAPSRSREVPLYALRLPQNESVARHETASKARWRERPRETLLRWDLDRGYGLYVIAMGGAWWLVFSFGWEAVSASGHSSGGRLASACWSLLALAAALVLTRLAWLYLGRPVRHRHDRA
jgi:hypothetical protein